MVPRLSAGIRDGSAGHENGPLETEMAELLLESRERESQYLEQSARDLPNFLQIPGRRIKISIDAILDGLLAKTTS